MWIFNVEKLDLVDFRINFQKFLKVRILETVGHRIFQRQLTPKTNF